MQITTIPDAATSVATLAAEVATLQATANGIVYFDPGGSNTGNTRTTIAAAVGAARGAGPGNRVIMLAAGSTVAGALDVSGVTISGYGASQPMLTIVEGTTLTSTDGAVRFDNVVVQWSGTTPPVEASESLGFAAVVLTTNAQIQSSGSTGVFAHAAASLYLLLTIGNGCQIDGSSDHALFGIATGGAFMFCDFYPASVLGSNTLTGGDDASIFVTDYGAQALSHTQTGTTGIVYASH